MASGRSRKRRTSRMSMKDKIRRRRTLLRRQSNRCHWCGVVFTDENGPTFDHLKPRILGGTDALDNLVLSCADCNDRRANPPLGRRRDATDGAYITTRDGAQTSTSSTESGT